MIELLLKENSYKRTLVGEVLLTFNNNVKDIHGHETIKKGSFTYVTEPDGAMAVNMSSRNDLVRVIGTQDLLPSGDFTLEGEFNFSSTNTLTTKMIFGFDSLTVAKGRLWSVRWNTNNTIYIVKSDNNYHTVTLPLLLETYFKLALCRQADTFKVFVNDQFITSFIDTYKPIIPIDLILHAAQSGDYGFVGKTKYFRFVNGISLY